MAAYEDILAAFRSRRDAAQEIARDRVNAGAQIVGQNFVND